MTMRYFEDPNDGLVLVARDGTSAELYTELGYVEVTVRPKRSKAAGVIGAVIVGGVVALAVGLIALGLKLVWTAVLS